MSYNKTDLGIGYVTVNRDEVEIICNECKKFLLNYRQKEEDEFCLNYLSNYNKKALVYNSSSFVRLFKLKKRELLKDISEAKNLLDIIGKEKRKDNYGFIPREFDYHCVAGEYLLDDIDEILTCCKFDSRINSEILLDIRTYSRILDNR